MGSRHFPARTVLFERELNGVTYRVPALLYIHCMGKLLAFAEERLSADDAHANLLVLRRGSFYRNSVEWEDMRALETATLRHHRSMNPCPVYDEFTGIVFLFFVAVLGKTPEAYQIITGHNAARLCYVASSDQGLSWSKVTDLTEQVIEWATFALGPGHGIQLKSGRLLVPAYAYHIDCKECFGKLCKTTPHSFTFYSDDHGQTWHYGEFIPNLQTGECQLASVDEEDGSNVLYCNARSPLGFRVQALSTDDGAVFHSGQLVPRLVEPPHGCQGSIIGFPAPLFYSPTDILEKINTLNLSLQGKGDVLTMSEKVTAFQKKLMLWRQHFENGCLEMFPSLCDFGAENYVSVSPIKTLISAHLKNLETEFSNLFKNLPNKVSVGFEI
uniref:exo-alpha-sialidase n=1 Tax=Crocodylus porosus TaxID=8502 RepID=A0A7M4ESN5_CROPO